MYSYYIRLGTFRRVCKSCYCEHILRSRKWITTFLFQLYVICETCCLFKNLLPTLMHIGFPIKILALPLQWQNIFLISNPYIYLYLKTCFHWNKKKINKNSFFDWDARQQGFQYCYFLSYSRIVFKLHLIGLSYHKFH